MPSLGNSKGANSDLKKQIMKEARKELSGVKNEIVDGVMETAKEIFASGMDVDIDKINLDVDLSKSKVNTTFKGDLKGTVQKEINKQLGKVEVQPELEIKSIKGIDVSEFIGFDKKKLKKKIDDSYQKAINSASAENSKKFIGAAMVGLSQGIDLDKQTKEYLEDLQKYYGITGDFVNQINKEIAKIDFSPIQKNLSEPIANSKDQIKEITKNVKEYNKAISKMKKPSFHIGNLEDNDGKHIADHLYDKKSLNRLGSGLFLERDYIQALEDLKSERKSGRKAKLYITDLADVSDKMMNIPTEEVYDEYTNFLGLISNFILKTANITDKAQNEAALSKANISNLDDLYKYGKEYFDHFGVTQSRLNQVVKEAVQYVKTAPKDVENLDDLSSFVQQKAFKLKGVKTDLSPTLDNYNVGSVVFHKEDLGDIFALSDPSAIASSIAKQLIEKSLKEKAGYKRNSHEDILDILDQYKSFSVLSDIYSPDEVNKLFSEVEVVSGFKEIAVAAENADKNVSEFLQGIKDGSIKASDEIKELIETLKLSSDISILDNGTRHSDGFKSDQYTLIQRSSDYLAKTEALIPLLKEAEERGVRVGSIIGTITDDESNLYYEIQKTQDGKIIDQSNLEFLDATDKEIQQLARDLSILQELGLFVDTGGQNLMYQKGKGFSFIDLAVPKDLKNIPDYLTNSKKGIIDSLNEFLPYDKSFNVLPEYQDKFTKFEALFNEVGDVAKKTGDKASKAMSEIGKTVDEAKEKVEDIGKTGETAGDKIADGMREAREEAEKTANTIKEVSDVNKSSTIIHKATGKEISPEAYNIIDRLEKGEKVSTEELESIPEVVEGLSNLAKVTDEFVEKYRALGIEASQTSDLHSEERKALREYIISLRHASGSFSGLDENGKDVFNGAIKRQNKAVIVMGLPAAGKSTSLVNPLSQLLGAKVIDSDIVKELLPEYQNGRGSMLVHEESSDLNKRFLREITESAKITKQGENVIVPIVGDTVEKVEKYINQLKDAGYDVEVALNELPNNVASLRNLMRYFNVNRFIRPALVSSKGDRPSEAFEQLKSNKKVDSYLKVNNNVEKGKRPVLIESNKVDQDILDALAAKDAGKNKTTDVSNIKDQAEQVKKLNELLEQRKALLDSSGGRDNLTTKVKQDLDIIESQIKDIYKEWNQGAKETAGQGSFSDSIAFKANNLKELQEEYKELRRINHDLQLYEDPNNYSETGLGKSFNAIGLKKTGSSYEELKAYKKELLELNPILEGVEHYTERISNKDFVKMFGSDFGMSIASSAKKAGDAKDLIDQYNELILLNQRINTLKPNSALAIRMQAEKDAILELNPVLKQYSSQNDFFEKPKDLQKAWDNFNLDNSIRELGELTDQYNELSETLKKVEVNSQECIDIQSKLFDLRFNASQQGYQWDSISKQFLYNKEYAEQAKKNYDRYKIETYTNNTGLKGARADNVSTDTFNFEKDIKHLIDWRKKVDNLLKSLKTSDLSKLSDDDITNYQDELSKLEKTYRNYVKNSFFNNPLLEQQPLKQIDSLINSWFVLQSEMEKTSKISSDDKTAKNLQEIGKQADKATDEVDELNKSLSKTNTKSNEDSISLDEELNTVPAQIDKVKDEFEDLGNGEKRVISDIGLTYDQLIGKIKEENEEVKEGNRLFEERVSYLKNGVVVDSYQGQEKNVKGLTDKEYDKIVHTHPSDHMGANFLSANDIYRFAKNKTLPTGKLLSEVELISDDDVKVILKIGELSDQLMDQFTDLYYALFNAVGTALGDETEFGKITPSASMTKEVMGAYMNSIGQTLIKNLGGDLSFNPDTSDINKISKALSAQILQKTYELTKEISSLPMDSPEVYQQKWREMIHNKFESFRQLSQSNETPVSNDKQIEELKEEAIQAEKTAEAEEELTQKRKKRTLVSEPETKQVETLKQEEVQLEKTAEAEEELTQKRKKRTLVSEEKSDTKVEMQEIKSSTDAVAESQKDLSDSVLSAHDIIQQKINETVKDLQNEKHQLSILTDMVNGDTKLSSKSTATQSLKHWNRELLSQEADGRISDRTVVTYMNVLQAAKDLGVAQSTLDRNFNPAAIGRYEQALENVKNSYEVTTRSVEMLESELENLREEFNSLPAEADNNEINNTEVRKKRSIASSKEEVEVIEEVAAAQEHVNEVKKAEPESKSWQDAETMQELGQIISQMDLAGKKAKELKEIFAKLNMTDFDSSNDADSMAYVGSAQRLSKALEDLGYKFNENTKNWSKSISSAKEFAAAMQEAAAKTDEAAVSQEHLNQEQREQPKTQVVDNSVSEAVTKERAEVEQDVTAESTVLKGLTDVIGEVAKAIDNKTERFGAERKAVIEAIDAEINKLRELQQELDTISSGERNIPKSDGTTVNISGEIGPLTDLYNLLNNIIIAIREKTQAFNEEGLEVTASVNAENDALTLLLETLKQIADVAEKVKIPAGEKLQWANDLKNLNAEDIAKIGTNLTAMYQSISALNVKDSNFIKQLNEILNKGKELENLTKVLSASKKDIAKTKEATISNTEKAKRDNYAEELKIKKEILGLEHEINLAEAKGSQKAVDIRIRNEERVAALREDLNKVYAQRGGSKLKDDSLAKANEKALEAIERKNQSIIEGERKIREEHEKSEAAAKAQQEAADKKAQAEKEAAEKAAQAEKEASEQNDKAAKAYKDLTSQASKYFELLQRESSNLALPGELELLNEIREGWIKAADAKEEYAFNSNGSITSQNNYNSAKDSFNDKIRDASIGYAKNLQEIGIKATKFADSKRYTDELTNDLRKLSADIDEINSKPIDITNPQEIKQTEQLRIESDKLFERVKSNEEKLASADTIAKLNLKIEEFMRKNSNMGKKFRQEFNDLKIEWDKDNIPVERVKELTAQFVKLEAEVNAAGKTGLSFFDKIKSQIVNTSARFIGYYFSFMDIIRYSRQAFESIRELDTALVDLKKTTTMSAQELEKFYFSSNDVAKSLGATTAEIISQAAAWSRLGYSTNEQATAMAKLSAQFAAISPGMDLEKSTDGLVSSMKAFGVEVDDVQRKIMDNINRIGNTMATSNDEIVDMLTRSSAAMNAANNSIEETIALESAAVQITRNAETTGTAFRTISMRIRGYDEETEEFIGNIEDLTGKIADLTKTAKTPGGISLFTDTAKTQYKSTYQLLKEIASIYQDLTDKNQAALLETLAGKRGGQVLAGILNDFSEVERAMGEMEKAAGSAEAEMSIIEESLDFKINKLKETWVGVIQDMVDRGQIGTIIDSVTKLSDAISFLIDKVGLLNLGGLGIEGLLMKNGLGLTLKVVVNKPLIIKLYNNAI